MLPIWIRLLFGSNLSGKRLNHLIQTALVPRGLVLVNNAFVNHAVDNWHCGAVSRYGCFLVAFLDRLYDVFDMGPHFGAKAHLVEPRFLRLAGAFPG